MAIHITDADDFKARLTEAGSKLVVVDFYATWCGPCKMLAPILNEIAETMVDAVVVLKVDVDENEALAMEYNIDSMPTLIFIKNTEKLYQFSGYDEELLKSSIEKYK